MGALHAGHQSLITRARRSCRTVIVSIFVNPLQFGPKEDFRRYPRTLSHDLSLCRKENVDVVFLPKLDDLFPPPFQTTVTTGPLSHQWEGEHRPTHFQGVATVMTKLLNLVRPTRTFLGQKDYQQFLVIKQLVHDLALDTKVTLCPTIRDPDGLALSSRNQYLTPSQRPRAILLYRALSFGKQAIANGERQAKRVEQAMATSLRTLPNSRIDYLACCDPMTLQPLTRLRGKVVLIGALRLETIRLIDNLFVQVKG